MIRDRIFMGTGSGTPRADPGISKGNIGVESLYMSGRGASSPRVETPRISRDDGVRISGQFDSRLE